MKISITSPRKPAAFRIESEAASMVDKQPKARPVAERQNRAPRATVVVELVPEPDVFAQELNAIAPVLPIPMRRGWTFGGLFMGALGVLVSLAIGLWVDQLIRDLFARSDWLGYFAFVVAVIALIALLIVAARELAGLSRLNAAQALRVDGAQATLLNDRPKAQAVIVRLENLFTTNAATARGRALLAENRDEIMDGRDLIRLAEHGLLKPLDDQARRIILDSSKRVSIVTAVSPRALVDLAYVVYESSRLIRRLAELYGGRPGTLGLFRLSRNVLAHLAVTGSIAVGDSLVQQLVGHGVAARLSARLGEGVINGLMTARIGISAMDIVRPLPFDAEKRPGIGDFLSDLTSLTAPKS